MQFFGPDEVAIATPWPALIRSIEEVFVTDGAVGPDRTVHQVEVPGGPDASLLLKPGWIIGDVIAVKVVTFFPNNGQLDLATVNAGVLLFNATNGVFLGACDGNVLTARRTAAASAVAADRLARDEASRLLVVGTGALGPMTAQAHASVRSFDHIDVWGRTQSKAESVAQELQALGLPAHASADLDASVEAADVISCVTGSTTPLIKGSLLKDGTHVDLIGAFTPAMRETDDETVRRARIWVDTKTDAVLAGDLSQPLEAGVISLDDLEGDLAELISGGCPTRNDNNEITLFKSAGTALEDVAAAKLVFDR